MYVSNQTIQKYRQFINSTATTTCSAINYMIKEVQENMLCIFITLTRKAWGSHLNLSAK